MSLQGLRVIELGTVIAGPFAGSLLADMGAEVIKIEPPGPGDVLRQMGPIKDGVPIWWGVNARGKRCVSLDLKTDRGKALFKSLVAKADVLIENFRPDVLKRLGLDWPVLHELNPRLVMLSISGFGHTGPQAAQPGFGKIAECMSGLVSLTGPPEDRPLFVGFSLADASTGLMGVFGVMVALFQRDVAGGEGAHVDIALYEPLFRMLDIQRAMSSVAGPVMRRGTDDPYQWGVAEPREVRFGSIRSSSGDWLFVAIPDLQSETALDDAMRSGAESTIEAFWPRLVTFAAGLATVELKATLAAAGVEFARVHDGGSIAADPYFIARGDVVPAVHPVLGEFSVPGFIEEAQDGSERIAFRAVGVGADNSDVLSRWLGLTEAQIEALRREGVI
jgi:crotonobetainyl-CoA:carnitine CoA-transferase CaiB-like acyl-CoA transferase